MQIISIKSDRQLLPGQLILCHRHIRRYRPFDIDCPGILLQRGNQFPHLPFTVLRLHFIVPSYNLGSVFIDIIDLITVLLLRVLSFSAASAE